MGKSTISMAIFNSYVNVYQRVSFTIAVSTSMPSLWLWLVDRCLSSTWPIPIVQGIAKLVYKGYNQDLWYWFTNCWGTTLYHCTFNERSAIRSLKSRYLGHNEWLPIGSKMADWKMVISKESHESRIMFLFAGQDFQRGGSCCDFNASMMSPRSLELLEQHRTIRYWGFSNFFWSRWDMGPHMSTSATWSRTKTAELFDIVTGRVSCITCRCHESFDPAR